MSQVVHGPGPVPGHGQQERRDGVELQLGYGQAVGFNPPYLYTNIYISCRYQYTQNYTGYSDKTIVIVINYNI